jgi:hypothetical protein
VALAVFKTVCDLTIVGLGGFDSHALPPARVRSHSVMMRIFELFDRRSVRVVVAAALMIPAAAGAQRDTARVAGPIRSAADIPRDSAVPPISPRRAFLYSFLVPGSGQSILGRHKAAATFLFVEAVCLAMIRESGADVHEARRSADDSLIVSYVDQFGNPAVTKAAPRFGGAEIHTREAHVEDWAALMVGNHLFSGADAFVAAHLWDVRVRLGMRTTPGGRALAIRATIGR